MRSFGSIELIRGCGVICLIGALCCSCAHIRSDDSPLSLFLINEDNAEAAASYDWYRGPSRESVQAWSKILAAKDAVVVLESLAMGARSDRDAIRYIDLLSKLGTEQSEAALVAVASHYLADPETSDELVVSVIGTLGGGSSRAAICLYELDSKQFSGRVKTLFDGKNLLLSEGFFSLDGRRNHAAGYAEMRHRAMAALLAHIRSLATGKDRRSALLLLSILKEKVPVGAIYHLQLKNLASVVLISNFCVGQDVLLVAIDSDSPLGYLAIGPFQADEDNVIFLRFNLTPAELALIERDMGHPLKLLLQAGLLPKGELPYWEESN